MTFAIYKIFPQLVTAGLPYGRKSTSRRHRLLARNIINFCAGDPTEINKMRLRAFKHYTIATQRRRNHDNRDAMNQGGGGSFSSTTGGGGTGGSGRRTPPGRKDRRCIGDITRKPRGSSGGFRHPSHAGIIGREDPDSRLHGRHTGRFRGVHSTTRCTAISVHRRGHRATVHCPDNRRQEEVQVEGTRRLKRQEGHRIFPVGRDMVATDHGVQGSKENRSRRIRGQESNIG